MVANPTQPDKCNAAVRLDDAASRAMPSASTSPLVTGDALQQSRLCRHRRENHRSKLERSSERKLSGCVLQDLLRNLERWRLDDRSRELVNLRDRHVATVSHGAEQIACEILHHW